MTWDHIDLAGGKSIAVPKEPAMKDGSVKGRAFIYGEGRSLFIEEHGLSGPKDKVQHCRTLEIPMNIDQCDDLMDVVRDIKRALKNDSEP